MSGADPEIQCVASSFGAVSAIAPDAIAALQDALACQGESRHLGAWESYIWRLRRTNG